MIDRAKVEAAIIALEAQRLALSDDIVETAIAALRKQIALTEKQHKAAPVQTGERKLVTVMFADISGFTAMSEKLDPEDVRNLLNACFDCLGAVIDSYEGHIDKFIGDEIMALFGAPVAHENDPERALRAALDMMTVLDQFNRDHSHQIPAPLALHFGINTGLAVAGGIGTSDRQDYSVMGDTVNLAARLEDLSERGEILVGEDTYRLTAPLFEFEALPPVKVKGKEKPVQVYRVLKSKGLREQIRGIEGLQSQLVGRQNELAQLQKVLQSLTQGQGGVVSIVGEAGLGKSRLIQELQQTPLSRPVSWARGRALSYGQSASYLVARDTFGHLLGLGLETPSEEIDQALRDEINRFLPEEFAEIYPYLAYLLELPLDDAANQRVKYLEGDALHRRIYQAIQSLIAARAKHQPLVLIWDDLHWADPSSLNLLFTLLPLTHTHRLLLLLIYRPVRDGRIWAFHERTAEAMADDYQSIFLNPLPQEESSHLVDNLVGASQLTPHVRQLIVRKADGNPFYIEEVIRSLIEDGTLAHSEADNCWMLAEGVEDITIPDTLQGVIMARVDQLDAEAKRTLQIASVIGRTFPFSVLDQVIRQTRNNRS